MKHGMWNPGVKVVSPFWQIAIQKEIDAKAGGAIAAIWHSHWRQDGYEYRKSHKARDEKVFVMRGNWALEKGLMKLAGRKYTDEITSPGEEEGCRCYYQYLYSLRDLPEEMLSTKGKEELERVRKRAS